MSVFTVESEQRGPFLNMVLTIMRREEDSGEHVTNSIEVNDLAIITGKLTIKSKTRNYQLLVGLKKTEAAKNFTVLVSISSGGINKQIICQNEWTEVPIISSRHSMNSAGYYQPHTIFLHTMKVNITVQVKIPIPTALAAVNQLYEDTEFTDFKLEATDGAVAIHKHVFLNHSEFFRTMLRGQWKETQAGTINMDGVTVQTLQHLKDYMYLGTFPENGLEPLLLVARRCLMDDLVAGCIDKLITTVTPETIDGLVEFAIENNLPALVKGLLISIPNDIINSICKLQNIGKKE